MSPRRDPKWIELALKAYDTCLPLYPQEVRDAHGDEMRQTFRDRCLEVARGQRSAWQWFALEMAPDLVGSAARAHWDDRHGAQRGRQRLALAMLTLSLLLLAFQDSVSSSLLDLTFKTRYEYFSAQAARVEAAEEDRVRGLANELASDASPESKAQAAFLYRTLYSSTHWYSAATDSAMEAVMAARATDESQGRVNFDRFFLGDRHVADGDSASVALDGIGSADKGWIAAAAILSCLPSAGCDRALAIARLIALEPDNAYGWSLRFKLAMRAHDEGGVRNALARMAAARYYEDHLGEIQHEILGASLRWSPEDVEARAAVARRVAESVYLGTDDFLNDARLQCSRRNPGQSPPTWAESHPESEADCLRFARLLTRSRIPFDAFRGWALIAQRDGSPATQSALARAQIRYSASFVGIGSTRQGDSNRWEPWSAEQWSDWAKAQ